MRQRRARKIKNPDFPPTDPRRWEPGPLSAWRAQRDWRERWYAWLVCKDKLRLEEADVRN